MNLLRNVNFECKQLLASLILGVILTAGIIRNLEASERAILLRTQAELSEEVLRFHVLANSDNEDDQALKMAVKEAVISYMREFMPESENLQATKLWVENNLEHIERISREVLREEGSVDSVSVDLETVEFPRKSYGDVTFPAGEYEALRIEIGEATGQNWWCCLYPSLCFVDATYGVVDEEGKEQLQEVLTEESYEAITEKEVEIKWFFF